ncbi:septum formation family protein [Catellatospora sp. KI3]|uniref:septum formation family protein n=1 Tax=Catellatospora sp. KI3 TaxID=3041620 RepID=UPI00248232C7|nr:septum formation family protein [Catellatospora sp. KI3]MDI1462698.1 septum formation family protein [Catellatospora sp. KI3]
MTYRRLALFASAALMFAAGCSSTSSGDSQAGGSPSPSGAAAYQPKAGVCLKVLGDIERVTQERHLDKVVDCTAPHSLQIVGGGELGSDGASTEAMDKAYAECDGMARKFLGGADWRGGRLDIKVVYAKTTPPGATRWWECDLVPYNDYTRPASTSQDLSGGIPATLRYGCQTANENENDEIVDIQEVACSTPHHAEYAGAVVLPAGTEYPSSEASWEPIHDACNDVVAKFVGLPKTSSKLSYYSDLMRGESDWAKRRDVRCFVYFWPKKMTGSAKGKGKNVPW